MITEKEDTIVTEIEDLVYCNTKMYEYRDTAYLKKNLLRSLMEYYILVFLKTYKKFSF